MCLSELSWLNLGDTDQQFCEQQRFVIHCWSSKPPIVILCTRVFEGNSLFRRVTSERGSHRQLFLDVLCRRSFKNAGSHLMNTRSCCREFLFNLFNCRSTNTLEIIFLGINSMKEISNSITMRTVTLCCFEVDAMI